MEHGVLVCDVYFREISWGFQSFPDCSPVLNVACLQSGDARQVNRPEVRCTREDECGHLSNNRKL